MSGRRAISDMVERIAQRAQLVDLPTFTREGWGRGADGINSTRLHVTNLWRPFRTVDAVGKRASTAAAAPICDEM